MLVIRFFSCWFLGLALLASSHSASAQTDTATAETLMRDSGLWQMFDSIAPQMRAGVLESSARNGVKPGQAEIERLLKSVDEAYAVGRLRAAALASVKASVRQEHVPGLRRWYASGVGKGIVQLELLAAADQTPVELVMQQGVALLSAMPQARRDMLEEVVAVTQTAEILMQIMQDSVVAIHRGERSMTPDAPGISEQELRTDLESQRPQMLKAYTAFALASYAKSYATLPSMELAQYVAFLKSEPGRHFVDVGLKALNAALVVGSTEFGRRLPGTRDQANT